MFFFGLTVDAGPEPTHEEKMRVPPPPPPPPPPGGPHHDMSCFSSETTVKPV